MNSSGFRERNDLAFVTKKDKKKVTLGLLCKYCCKSTGPNINNAGIGNKYSGYNGSFQQRIIHMSDKDQRQPVWADSSNMLRLFLHSFSQVDCINANDLLHNHHYFSLLGNRTNVVLHTYGWQQVHPEVILWFLTKVKPVLVMPECDVQRWHTRNIRK